MVKFTRVSNGEGNMIQIAFAWSWSWEPNKKLMLPPLPIAISEQESLYQCAALCRAASTTNTVFGVFIFHWDFPFLMNFQILKILRKQASCI